MRGVIGKWGNSPALRIPVGVMKQAQFSLQQPVTMVVTPGRIVIEPSDSIEFDLSKLVAGITPENSHGEVSFSRPIGKEAL